MATFSQQFLSNLGNPTGMLAGATQLGQALGSAPGLIVEAQKKKKEAQINKEYAAAVRANSAKKLYELSNRAAGQGKTELAEQFLTKAQEVEQEVETQENFVDRKVSLANTAQNLGLGNLAIRISGIKDESELKEIAKEVRKLEVEQLPLSSPLVRKRVAKNAGINAEEFADLGLDKVSQKDFAAIIAGEKGNLKAYLDKENNVIQVRVNEAGMPKVYDEKKNKWVFAADLGLIEAPAPVQKIENVATGMADELAKVGAKTFTEAYEGAKKSAAALSTLNRSIPIIDNMFTGAFAEQKLNIARYARALGFYPSKTGPLNFAGLDSIADTETYIADAGQRVADYITNLGAGTGLSDADREYALKIVGGKITVDKASLARLLGTLKRYAEANIQQYKDTRRRVEQELGPDNKSALSFYPDNFYVDEGPIPLSSDAVDSYFQ